MGEFVWLNGSMVPKAEAMVSIIDRGFLYGDGLFETMRSYKKRIFRLDEHVMRLFRSAETLKLKIPYSLKELKEAVYGTIEMNAVSDGCLRLTVSRGEGEGRLDPPENGSANVVIVTKNSIPYSPNQYDRGFKAIVASVRRNEFSPISRMKSMNYLNNIVARMEARARGVDEAVMLNTNGDVACGTVSNIFLIKGVMLFTPSEDSGILVGITRGAILGLGPDLGLKVVEKTVSLPELMGSNEAFLTNSLMEVMPLAEVDGTSIGNGKPGSITVSLHRAYRELVERTLP